MYTQPAWLAQRAGVWPRQHSSTVSASRSQLTSSGEHQDDHLDLKSWREFRGRPDFVARAKLSNQLANKRTNKRANKRTNYPNH